MQFGTKEETNHKLLASKDAASVCAFEGPNTH